MGAAARSKRWPPGDRRANLLTWCANLLRRFRGSDGYAGAVDDHTRADEAAERWMRGRGASDWRVRIKLTAGDHACAFFCSTFFVLPASLVFLLLLVETCERSNVVLRRG